MQKIADLGVSFSHCGEQNGAEGMRFRWRNVYCSLNRAWLNVEFCHRDSPENRENIQERASSRVFSGIVVQYSLLKGWHEPIFWRRTNLTAPRELFLSRRSVLSIFSRVTPRLIFKENGKLRMSASISESASAVRYPILTLIKLSTIMPIATASP